MSIFAFCFLWYFYPSNWVRFIFTFPYLLYQASLVFSKEGQKSIHLHSINSTFSLVSFDLLISLVKIIFSQDQFQKIVRPIVCDDTALFSNLRVVEHFCILFLFRRYHLQIVLYMKLSVLISTFSYFHCLCLLKFCPSPMFATIGLLWLLLTSRHSLLLTDFILCFRPLTRPPLVPHVTFSPYICHIYYS